MSKNKVILVVLGVVIFAAIVIILGVLFYKNATEYKTNAVIIELGDNSILVAEYENPVNLYSLYPIDTKDNLLEGDKVIITHNGVILESYPSSFAKIYSIRKVGVSEITVYKEGLNIHLDFLKSFLELNPNDKEIAKKIRGIEDRLILLK